MIEFKKIKVSDLLTGLNIPNNQGTRVLTNGCFDVLHPGHIQFLNNAKKLGDTLIVLIDSDERVKKLKGEHRPILSEQERAYMLSQLKCVDEVYIFDSEMNDIVNYFKPNILVKGGDYKISEIVGSKEIKFCGGFTCIIDYYNGYSTTNIIEKIKALDTK